MHATNSSLMCCDKNRALLEQYAHATRQVGTSLSNSDLLLVDIDLSFQVPFPFACARFDRCLYVVVDTHARDIVAVSDKIFAEL